MKKMTIICAALFALASCEKQPVENPATPKNTSIVFNLSASHPNDAGTKAIKTCWEEGDAIFVFFSGASVPKYLKMTYSGGSWTSKEYDGPTQTDGALSSIASTGTMRAIFLPFGSGATVDDDGTGNYGFSTTYYSYYLTDDADYEVIGSTITGSFTMAYPAGFVQFFYDDATAIDGNAGLSVTYVTPTGLNSISGTTLDENTVSLPESAAMPGYAYDNGTDPAGYLFSGILAGEAQGTSKDYVLTLINGDSYTKTNKTATLNTGTSGNMVNVAGTNPSSTLNWDSTDMPSMIDLGLSVKWASCNLGATEDTEYGDYFAWGEVEPYYAGMNPFAWREGKSNGYSWESYKHNTDGAMFPTTIPKYNATDGFTTLQFEDDAAQVKIGGGWRMPTKAELEELLATKTSEDYTWTWYDGSTEQYKGTTVKGWKIEKNSSGASIFLPTAGDWVVTALSGVGNVGHYWSSDIGNYATAAWVLILQLPSYGGGFIQDSDSFFRGNSIRPVYKP